MAALQEYARTCKPAGGKGLRPLFSSAALFLCLAVTGAGADAISSSTSINISNGVSSSTKSSVTTSSTSSTSSTDSSSVGSAVAVTSCSVNAGDRHCEVACSAPKVARCLQGQAGKTPRCSCR